MNIHIVTIFPGQFRSITEEGMVSRAIKKGLVNINLHDLRDYTDDNYHSVDDHPYGGGAGMVMKISPIYKALEEIKKGLSGETLILLTSAKGEEFSQKKALSYSKYDNILIICGHYEGVDERVSEHLCDEEVSIGRYVLSNGELPAMVIVDSITRLIPGVLGNEVSLETESHNVEGVLEYPQYTKPEVFELDNGTQLCVPKVLLSGDHKNIEKWRNDNMKKI